MFQEFQDRRWKCLARLAVVMATAGFLSAGPAAHAHDEEEEAGPNQGKISMSAGFDVTTAYFFRGIFQENQGLIVQPWLDATATLTDQLAMTFGIWNSFHDTQTLRDGGAARSDGGGPNDWYEADLYVGFSYSGVENMELGLTYTALTSPNDAFGTVQELGFSLAYDDSAMWQDTPIASGLQPSVTVVVELDGQSDGGTEEGVYLQLVSSRVSR